MLILSDVDPDPLDSYKFSLLNPDLDQECGSGTRKQKTTNHAKIKHFLHENPFNFYIFIQEYSLFSEFLNFIESRLMSLHNIF